MPQATRGRALTVFAILFWILALSNLLKPFQFGGEQTGFVFFGARLSGFANAVIGPSFGVFLAVYAYGLWSMRRFALPMAHAYATYVILNLILFSFRTPTPDTVGYKIFGAVYAAIGIGVSLAAAVVVTQRKADLS
jgi:hypothetical protein